MRLITRPVLVLLLALSLTAYANNKTVATDKLDGPEQATENPYTKSFVNKGRPAIALQPDRAGPKLYRGQNQVEDFKIMLRNGFDMVGYSNFQGLDIPPEKAMEQAKNIKADMVLVYAQQKGSTPIGVQIDQARKKAQEGDPGGENAAPHDQKLYEYFASYWVKLAPPLIGVHVETNTQDENRFGLRVLAVVKESPAAKVGIQEDDVLTRIGDIAMDKPEALTQAAKRYEGKTVDVLYKRGESEGKTTMTLNHRQ